MAFTQALKLTCDPGTPSLTVRCARAEQRLEKLRSQSNFNRKCSYTFDGFQPGKLEVLGEALSTAEISEDTVRYTCETPVFYEQTDCTAVLSCPEGTVDARLFSPIAGLCAKAENGWDPETRKLELQLNFGNDLGDFELCFEWKLAEEDEWRTCSFRAQVFSTKLDIATHFNVMLEDVAERFKWLQLDLLRQTFWGWSRDSEAEVTQQTWLVIFQEVREEMGWAFKQLTHRHRKRLTGKEYRLRADQVKKLPPRLEEKIYRILQDRPDAKLRVERQFLDADTPENRYIKHLLMQCIRQLGEIGSRLEGNEKVSDVFKERLGDWERDWTRMRHQPFWNAIGPFHGLRGESLVLSQDPLYACIRRNWRWLQEGMALLNQDLKGGIQNAAQLYEIWCLVQLDKYLSEHADWSGTEENLIPFERSEDEWNPEERHTGTVKLRYNYILDGYENKTIHLDLLFQPTAGREPKHNYWDGMMSLPESQCPDLVLRLHRNDLPNQPVYTWIFDAKYRIETTREGTHVGAPRDAVDGMHRYRDAILWAADEHGKGRLTRESLGAFVLYPGEEIKDKPQNDSIERVNVGTFSLRPLKPDDSDKSAIQKSKQLAEKLKKLLHVEPFSDDGVLQVNDLAHFSAVPRVRSPYGHEILRVAIRSHMRSESYWETCRLYRLPIEREAQVYTSVHSWGWLIPTGEDGHQYGMFPILESAVLKRHDIAEIYRKHGNPLPNPDEKPDAVYRLFWLGEPTKVSDVRKIPEGQIIDVVDDVVAP
jgi:predicted component of viral defense system (DUF524 family)